MEDAPRKIMLEPNRRVVVPPGKYARTYATRQTTWTAAQIKDPKYDLIDMEK